MTFVLFPDGLELRHEVHQRRRVTNRIVAAVDFVLIVTAAGLQRVLTQYVEYYERSRTHLALDKDAPASRPVSPASASPIIAIPQVNGLHHRYERRAASSSDPSRNFRLHHRAAPALGSMVSNAARAR